MSLFMNTSALGVEPEDINGIPLGCLGIPELSLIHILTASAIKRNYEIKDYGKLIPGHGGILDRFDSVIFTAPVSYIHL